MLRPPNNAQLVPSNTLCDTRYLVVNLSRRGYRLPVDALFCSRGARVAILCSFIQSRSTDRSTHVSISQSIHQQIQPTCQPKAINPLSVPHVFHSDSRILPGVLSLLHTRMESPLSSYSKVPSAGFPRARPAAPYRRPRPTRPDPTWCRAHGEVPVPIVRHVFRTALDEVCLTPPFSPLTSFLMRR